MQFHLMLFCPLMKFVCIEFKGETAQSYYSCAVRYWMHARECTHNPSLFSLLQLALGTALRGLPCSWQTRLQLCHLSRLHENDGIAVDMYNSDTAGSHGGSF